MPRLGSLFCVLLLCTSSASACSIPVFRYALENWAASRYDVLVFHRGPLNKEERQQLLQLQTAMKGANVRLTECDIAQNLDPANREIWDREGKGLKLPHVLLRYPDAKPTMPSVWAGPLNDPAIKGLFTSPSRQQLFAQLTKGFVGAILLLQSGDRDADAAAKAFLEREAPKIAKKLVLPKRTAEGPQIKSDLPLLLEFPIIEVARSADDALTRQLLQSEEDLPDVKGPIAFPVFGRGRALCSLHGKDLEKPAELERALDFLCRACSCQVKELNPGIDLLLQGDWNVIFEERPAVLEQGPMPREVIVPKGVKRPTTPENPGIPEVRGPPPDGYNTGEARGTNEVAPPPDRTKQYALGGAALLVLVCLFWVYRSRQASLPPTT